MSEEVEVKPWLACPGSVKAVLPKKIENAVQYALDECFLELVGTPEAQRDKWVYKEIKARICKAMQEWIKEAMDEAIEKVLKK
jgi:hypothetical protein